MIVSISISDWCRPVLITGVRACKNRHLQERRAGRCRNRTALDQHEDRLRSGGRPEARRQDPHRQPLQVPAAPSVPLTHNPNTYLAHPPM